LIIFLLIIYSPSKSIKQKREAMMCATNICDLPSEIIAIIVGDLGKYEYYIGLNITCKLLSNLVSKFSLAKEMLNEFFEKFVPTKREYCINPKCVKETEYAMLQYWEAHSLAYEHTDRQAALNVTTMVVNGVKHWIRSHYCCECFKNHVLVGKNNNVSQHYGYYCDGVQEVRVIFYNSPYLSR
jgi:hypothetical protein